MSLASCRWNTDVHNESNDIGRSEQLTSWMSTTGVDGSGDRLVLRLDILYSTCIKSCRRTEGNRPHTVVLLTTCKAMFKLLLLFSAGTSPPPPPLLSTAKLTLSALSVLAAVPHDRRACPPGKSECTGYSPGCVDLQTDPDHCGTCDGFCSGVDAACVAGKCVCRQGETACPNDWDGTPTYCRNLQNEHNDCGECGHMVNFELQVLMGEGVKG